MPNQRLPYRTVKAVSFFRMTDFSDFGCFNLAEIHESIVSKNNIRIKSENIFYERIFKVQWSYMYNIFFPGC